MNTSQVAHGVVTRSGQTPRKWNASWVTTIVSGTVAALLLWRACPSIDAGDAAARLTAALPWTPLLLAGFLVPITLDTLGWRSVLTTLGHSLPFRDLLLTRLAVEAVQLSLPWGPLLAESLTPPHLRARCGTPIPDGLASIAARKSLLALTQSAFLVAAAVLGGAIVAGASREGNLPWLDSAFSIAAAGLLLVGAAAAVLLGGGSLAERVRRALERLPVPWLRHRIERARSAFGRFDSGTAEVFRARPLATSAFWFALNWIGQAFETWLLLHALGVPVDFAQALPIEAAASVLRIAGVAVPGALGVQEIGYVAFIAATGAPSPAAVSVAFASAKRLKEAFWIAIGYGLLMRLQASPVAVPS